MGHMPCGDVLARRIAVPLLIIKKDISAKCPKKRAFLLSPEKDGLINSDAPCPEGSNDPLMSRC